MTEWELLNIKIFLVKNTLKIGHFLLILFSKLILGHTKLKNKMEKNNRKFLWKKVLQSMLLMSYYPEQDSHIRDKVKVVLHLSNCPTKLELDHTTGSDTSDLASKNILRFKN